MTRMTLREIQQEELKLLKAFDRFCKKYNLKYTLSSGTLLGAVRHKGFIPWDDDIDVAMVRPEYEKMKKIFRKDPCVFGEKVHLVCDEDDSSWRSYSQLVNQEIIVQRKYFYTAGERIQHLWIDIFPIDGCPIEQRVIKKTCRKIKFWSLMLANCYAKLGKGTTVIRKFIKLPVILAGCLYGAHNCRCKLLKEIQAYPYETSIKCGPVFWGNYKLVFPKSMYEDLTEIEFEGQMFWTVAGWDEYLTAVYGDYMQMPSEGKRLGHDTAACRVPIAEGSEGA